MLVRNQVLGLPRQELHELVRGVMTIRQVTDDFRSIPIPAALGEAGSMIKETVFCFVEDGALSRGAAIAFYTATSLAPVLLIVMGHQTAEVLQTAIAHSAGKTSGILATIIGIVTLVATASGVFGEMQTALNAIWKASPRGTAVSRLVKARAASLGLVAALGFLLIVSLAVSAALTALQGYINAWLPFGTLIISTLNVIVSLALLSVLFAAIYKVLPDRSLRWRDVAIGGMATAVLFTIGKSLIGWYLGSSAIASTYGAAGGLVILCTSTKRRVQSSGELPLLIISPGMSRNRKRCGCRINV